MNKLNNTNPDNSSDSKLKDLKEEFKLIQKNISNWDNFSLSIKNWAITIWAAIIVFIGTQYYTQKADGIDLTILFWIPILLPLPFWFFDSLFKFFQRMSIIRGQAIEDYLNNSLLELDNKGNKRLEKRIEKFNKKSKEKTTINKESDKFKVNFPIYDPVSRVSKSFLFFDAKYNRKTNLFACFLVRIVTTVYCIILFLTILVIAIITGFYIISWFLFIPVIIVIVSWILSIKGIV